MKSFDGIVSHQVKTLTGVLHERADKRCREIRQEAKRRADALLAQGRHEARLRVHAAVLEERRRRESAIIEARQRLDTKARRQRQGHYQRLIDVAWPLLDRELAARWARPASRAEWCELVVDEAAHLLCKDGWIVEYPHSDTGAWSIDDRDRLEKLLAVRNVPPAEFQSDSALAAGLRIRRHGACLDGTTSGLLARREAVVARLLAHWEIEVSGNEPTGDGCDG